MHPIRVAGAAVANCVAACDAVFRLREQGAFVFDGTDRRSGGDDRGLSFRVAILAQQ